MKKDWNIFVTRLKENSKLHFKKRDIKKLPLNLPENDFKILNDNGCYYLLLSITNIKKENNNIRYSSIALDPGVRSFQTGYSPENHYIKIGSKYNEIIKSYYDKLDKLKELRSKSKKRRTKYNLSKKYRKTEKKLRDIIFDMHNQVSSYLSNNYENILIPNFCTSVMQKKNVLSSSIKRYLGTFSFYKFKNKLSCLCNKNNSKLYTVTEEYTSKTCTRCGTINSNLGTNKIFKCNNCDLNIDRDLNGARNILLKKINLIKKYFRQGHMPKNIVRI